MLAEWRIGSIDAGFVELLLVFFCMALAGAGAGDYGERS
jgi:hypothetical protein